MNRGLYIINLVLLIGCLVGFLTFIIGLMGMIALAVVQPICCVIYWTQIRTLHAAAFLHLRIYTILLFLAGVFASLIFFNIQLLDTEKVLTILGAFGSIMMAIYFTYIAYIIQKNSHKKVPTFETELLDSDELDQL
jgi:predicted membrane protein